MKTLYAIDNKEYIVALTNQTAGKAAHTPREHKKSELSSEQHEFNTCKNGEKGLLSRQSRPCPQPKEER